VVLVSGHAGDSLDPGDHIQTAASLRSADTRSILAFKAPSIILHTLPASKCRMLHLAEQGGPPPPVAAVCLADWRAISCVGSASYCRFFQG
jgi:hypothetical protein